MLKENEQVSCLLIKILQAGKGEMRFRAIFQSFIPLPKVTGINSVTLQRTRIKEKMTSLQRI